MHPVILSFVSILSTVNPSAQVTMQGPSVTVRSLVQGSGNVVCFEHARNMGKVQGRVSK